VKRVIECGGIDYAMKRMNDFRDEALAILHTFPNNDSRNALEELVHFTINRKK
jgi:octaprenyl-diphosphate synthase